MALRAVALALAAFAVGWAAFSLQRRHKLPDYSADEPPFNAMALPPRSIHASIYMDGGSVWVGVVDRNGRKHDVAFPYDHRTSGYSGAFHGVKHATEPGAKPLSNPARAKAIALELLARFGGRDEQLAHAYLSGKKDSVFTTVRLSVRRFFE